VEYLDFAIEMGVGDGFTYPIDVVMSPAGPRHGILHLEPDILGPQNRPAPGARIGDVEAYGSALFELLFAGTVGRCLAVSRQQAESVDRGLRIKLRIDDPVLATLPWELLYDVERRGFLAESRFTPIVRYVDLPRVVRPLLVTPPLRILGVIASPEDRPALNVEKERRQIEGALSDLTRRGLVHVEWLGTGGWEELQQAMRQGPWHVFHFVGHGRFDTELGEGILDFVSQTGDAEALAATKVGRLLLDNSALRVVVLNACEGARSGTDDVFSGTASALVRRGVPAVIAMRDSISDRAAVEFARAFYRAIADEPIDGALSEARKAIDVGTDSAVEWSTPVLYMSSLDGVLFQVDRGSTIGSGVPATPVVIPPVAAPVFVPPATAVAPSPASAAATEASDGSPSAAARPEREPAANAVRGGEAAGVLGGGVPPDAHTGPARETPAPNPRARSTRLGILGVAGLIALGAVLAAAAILQPRDGPGVPTLQPTASADAQQSAIPSLTTAPSLTPTATTIPATPTPGPTLPPTATLAPTPVPSVAIGGPEDPPADPAIWPTDAFTLKKWLPAKLRTTCSAASGKAGDAVPGAATIFLCSPDGALPDFKGTAVSVAYYFYVTESGARTAYDAVVQRFALRYDTNTCPNQEGAENFWFRTSDSDKKPLGRLMCALSQGSQAQYFETKYGQPVVWALYRDGKDLTSLQGTWAKYGYELEPAAVNN
jgi:hypothetical protein